MRPHGLHPARLLCPWDSPDRNTGVDCHAFLQGTFLTQESNPHPFTSWQKGSLPIVPPRKPDINGRVLVFPAEKFIMQKIAHETFQNSFSKDVYGLEGRGRFYAGEELDVSPSTHLAIRMHCTIYCTNSSPKAASKFCFLPNPWKKLAPKRLITIKLVVWYTHGEESLLGRLLSQRFIIF